MWIVGSKPDWVRNVGYMPREQPASKYQNSTENVLAACRNPDISDPFLLFNDDFFILARLEEMPVLHWGPVRPAPTSRFGASPYHEGRVETQRLLRRWGYERPLSYELHVPLPIHKAAMLEAVERAKPHHIRALHKRTLYGNVAGIGGEYSDDVKIHKPAQTFRRGDRFVSTNPSTWSDGQVGDDLRGMFNRPGPYEADDKEGADMAAKTDELVVVTERAKTRERLADGRLVQRVFQKGQKVSASYARKHGLQTKAVPGSKTAAKAAAKAKTAETDTPPAEAGAGGAICDECGKTFKNESGVASHKRAKH